MNIRGKCVLVVGLGKSGVAACRLLREKGALVRATDRAQSEEMQATAASLRKKGIETQIGCHTPEFVRGVDLVVASPGVPDGSPPLALAVKNKIKVISEIELASWFCKGRIIAITGTNGKSTTCALVRHLLKEAGRETSLCGNFGFPFSEALSSITSKTEVVLEVSSFQLEKIDSFKPAVAVILNLQPNHQDRHGSFSHYCHSKFRIFENQTQEDWCLLNADSLHIREAALRVKSRLFLFGQRPLEGGVFGWSDSLFLANGKRVLKLFDELDSPIQGFHYQENVLAAVSIALLLKVSLRDIQKGLRSFRPLHHRLEWVGEHRGVKFFNDSKSTTIASTRAALLSFPSPVILIAGGRDKGAPFEEVESLMHQRVKHLVLYGEAREVMRHTFQTMTRIDCVARFDEAVFAAWKRSKPGDRIILSPMCTSFDQFGSFEERGERFKEIVHEIVGQKN